MSDAYCSNTATGSALVWVNPLPTATISGSHTICEGATASLTVDLTGTAPWSISYFDGTTPVIVTDILATPYVFDVTPAVTTEYTLIGVSDVNCVNTATGSALVWVNPLPTATISGSQTICAGATAELVFDLTGTPPWDISFLEGTNPVTVYGVVSNPFIFAVSPPSTMEFTLTGVSDANCSNTATGSALIWVNPLPTALIAGSQTICEGFGAPLTVEFTGSAPWNIAYNDGHGNTEEIFGITDNPFTFIVSPEMTSLYTITEVTDGNNCSNTGTGFALVLVVPTPVAPTVNVENFCGYSVLTASDYTGELLWSTGETTPIITVTLAGTYTVSQTVDGCTSLPGSGIAAPFVIPPAPIVTVEDFCGFSVLTASAYTGELFWSTGEDTPSIIVTIPGDYTVTQTIGGCTSLPGIGVAAPLTVPEAPIVAVENLCGYSVLTASGYTGDLMWSTGEITPSIIVTIAGDYSVTQSFGGCTSLPGFGVAAPLTVPDAPVVEVENFCGYSVLTATEYTGELFWSTGENTPSIIVTIPGDYTVTQTVGGCTSLPGIGVAAPLSVPDAPVVTVENFCGYSVLTANGYTGDLMWSTGETTPSIIVTLAGDYTVTQTVGECTSIPGLGVATPLTVPDAPVVNVENFCGYSVLTASGYTGDLLWSTGETTAAIIVAVAGDYSVTQTVGGCTSLPGSGFADPLIIPSAPVVTVQNFCGYSVLTATGYTGTLLWSNGETTQSITVIAAGIFTVTQTVGGCESLPGSGEATPLTIPDAPFVYVDNFCGYSVLTASNYTGTLLWSTGETTPTITVSVAGTYSVTQTVGGCTSTPGSGVAAPLTIPNAPTVTVVDNCGYSILTASSYTGTLLWSTGETTPSITVTIAGAYSVTQSFGGCTSLPGSGIANPIAIPEAPIVTKNGYVLTSNYPNGNQWYYEGTLIEGATGQTYTVTHNTGYYSCTVTINGCTSAMSNLVWVDVVGVPEMPSEASFTIYPVPNNGEFTASIQYPSEEIFDIIVYSQLGSKIYELKDIHVIGGKCEQHIDLRPVSTGIYSVVFMNKDHKVIRKVLVNR